MSQAGSSFFEEKPAISRWKRLWLWAVFLLSVCGITAMGYAIKFHDTVEVFNVFTMVIFFTSGGIAGWPAVKPREVEARFPDFAYRAARVSTIMLLLAAALGFAGMKIAPHI